MAVMGLSGIGTNGATLYSLSGLTRIPFAVSVAPKVPLDQLQRQLHDASATFADALLSPGSANVSDAAGKLNAALSQLDDVDGGSEIRQDAESRIRSAIDSVSGAGLRGLTIGEEDGQLRIRADQGEIQDSRNQAGSTLTTPLDTFATRLNAIAAPSVPKADSRLSPLQVREILKAQDPAPSNLQLTDLLFPTASPQKASTVYSQAAVQEQPQAVSLTLHVSEKI